MIGYSSGRNKDASLVSKVFASVKANLNNIQVFHTDRDKLQYKLADYVNWFNNHRVHSALGYLTPYQYKMNHLINIV